MFENWTNKDFKKAAFAVGFGFTLGKGAAKFVSDMLNGIGLELFKTGAKNGNEILQKACDKNGIKYKDSNEQTEKKPECKIGFH